MPCRHNTGEAVGWHVPPAIKQTDNLVPIPTGRRPSRFKGMGRDRTAHRRPGRCKSGRQSGQYKSRRTSGYLAGRQGHGRARTGGGTDQPDSSNNPRCQAQTRLKQQPAPYNPPAKQVALPPPPSSATEEAQPSPPTGATDEAPVRTGQRIQSRVYNQEA